MELTLTPGLMDRPLVGVFMCRPVKNTENQLIDLKISWQNSKIQNSDAVRFPVPGACLSAYEDVGVLLPASFWHDLETQGIAAFKLEGAYTGIEWQVLEADDSYLLTVRKTSTQISDLKNGQKQLFLANERLKLATQAGKLGIWEFKSQTMNYDWDEVAYQIHGVEQGTEITTDYYLTLVHPEDLPYLLEMMARDDFKIKPIRIIRPDNGEIRYVISEAMPIAAHEGVVVDMIGVVSDITESHLAQLALAESEKRYRFLVDNLKEVIFQTDLQLNLTFLSQSWAELTGFEVEKAFETARYDFVHPDDRPIGRQQYKALLDRTVDHTLFEVRYLHKEFGYRWVEVFTKLTFDEGGRPSGTIGTLYDISDRKKIEIALAKSEKRFKAIFNSAFQFIALTDTEGIVLEVNQTALDSGDLRLEEVSGKPFWETYWWQISPQTKEQLRESIALASEGRFIHYEVDHFGKNRAVITVDFSINPILNDDGKVILLLIEGHDITERKRTGAALIESEQRFRDIAENVDELFWIRPVEEFRFLYMNSAYERICGKSRQSLYENPLSFLDFVLEEDREALKSLFSNTNIADNSNLEFRVKNKEGAVRWLSGRIFIIRDEFENARRRIGIASDITSQKEKEFLLTDMLD